jgi:hypothetical protein
LIRDFDIATKARKAVRELMSKDFKKFYNGQPTKRYLRLSKQIKAGEGLSETQFLMG